jgi:hypothetical protein
MPVLLQLAVPKMNGLLFQEVAGKEIQTQKRTRIGQPECGEV